MHLIDCLNYTWEGFSITLNAPTRWPGLLLTLVLASVAALLGTQFPVVGGAVFGILLGLLTRATGRISATFRPGIAFSAKQLLQFSIILLGFSLSLGEIINTGAISLWVMLTTLAAGLGAAWLLGRLLRISPELTILVGVGTSICGASAIAAVSPVIEAEEKDVAYAISTIFLFNVAAVLIFPPLGHLLGLGQESFGLWAGTAVNDTSSVVAAAYSYGHEAGLFATVVKLTRTTMIIPIALTLAGMRAVKAREAGGESGSVSVRRLVPWFILWFLAAALVNSLGLLPAAAADAANRLGKFLIVVALTAVGLSADFRKMTRTGLRPILLGGLLWLIVAVTSLLVQSLTGQLG